MKNFSLWICLSLFSLHTHAMFKRAASSDSLLQTIFSRQSVKFSEPISLSLIDIDDLIIGKKKASRNLFILAQLYDLIVIHHVLEWKTLKAHLKFQLHNGLMGESEQVNTYYTIFQIEAWIYEILGSSKNRLDGIKLHDVSAFYLVKQAWHIWKGFDDEFYYETP